MLALCAADRQSRVAVGKRRLPTRPAAMIAIAGAQIGSETETAIMPAEDVAALWQQYWERRDTDTRNQLVEHYRPLMLRIAKQISRRVPLRVDELASWAFEGLVEAIEKYDPERRASFETYATRCVQWAIRDGLRDIDDKPRLVRLRERQIALARQAIEQKMGRQAEAEDIRLELGLSRTEYLRHEHDALLARSVPLDAVAIRGNASWHRDGETAHYTFLPDKRTPPPDDAEYHRDWLRHLLNGLSRAERLIMILYYYEDMPMWEIGKVIGVSESHVCQTHARILRFLRQKFENVTVELP